MPKAYWIARVDVHDPETYKNYVETAKPAFERYNAKFLARGGKTEVLEGKARARNVIIEFASMEDAHGLLQFAGIHRGARHPPDGRARANSSWSKALNRLGSSPAPPLRSVRARLQCPHAGEGAQPCLRRGGAGPRRRGGAGGQRGGARRRSAPPLGNLWRPREVVVRINPLSSPWKAKPIWRPCDEPQPDAILLPKVEGAADIAAAKGGHSGLGDDRDAARVLNLAAIAASGAACLVLGTNDLLKAMRGQTLPDRAQSVGGADPDRDGRPRPWPWRHRRHL